MVFVTDKQTLDDLVIFGANGKDAVFSIFNYTSTLGGSSLLEDMFTYPFSNAKSINERVETFQEFAQLNISFPFNAELFGIIEHYLEQIDERTKLVKEKNNIGKKIHKLIGSEINHDIITKGVKSLREVIIDLYFFLQADIIKSNSVYNSEKQAVLSMLLEQSFIAIIQQGKVNMLTQSHLVENDSLFRFTKKAAIKQLLRFIYHLDVYITVAKVAIQNNYCFPKALLQQTNGLKIQQVYHPLVKNAVANNFEIVNQENVVFLTGANMAGKSTFMKTIGIAIFLAHAGFPVPAKSMEFSVMDGLYTTINLPDNLKMGSSHFYAEVLRVKKISKELGASKKLFVIFDELFRGTNVKDAFEATVAILSAFAKKGESQFVISTHIIEAGQTLKEKNIHMQCLYLPTKMIGTQPQYPYTLERGITNDRHGMLIIKNEGILEILKPKVKIPA